MFRRINLETLTILHYSFRDWGFHLIHFENLTNLAYHFRDSKCFAILI